jgi:hypothetical protein
MYESIRCIKKKKKDGKREKKTCFLSVLFVGVCVCMYVCVA